MVHDPLIGIGKRMQHRMVGSRMPVVVVMVMMMGVMNWVMACNFHTFLP
jgi:hypothetical protein